MIDVSTNDFPPFLEEEFERMLIPGEEKGFAISFSSFKRKECVACGLQGNVAISMSYSGDEYAVERRKPISLEDFESLYHSVPNEARRSGFIGAEDILDGESYLVKWSAGTETTRLVLCNPQHVDDEAVRQLASRLDEVMRKANKASRVAGRETPPSPFQKLPAGDRE